MSLFIITLLLAGSQLILSQDTSCSEEYGKICMDQYLRNFTNLPADLKDYTKLTDLSFLWKYLHEICSHSDEVQKHYQCVFDGLSSCFQKANDSRQDQLPDASRISQAIKMLCNSHTDINQTCFENTITDAESCYVTTKTPEGSADCSSFKLLVQCFEEQTDCDGYDVIEEFLMGTEPAYCAGTVQQLALSLLLVAFAAFFLKDD